DLGLPAQADDGLLGARAELVGAHGEGLGEAPLPQDLEAIPQALDRPPLQEQLGSDDGAGIEGLQALQVDAAELLADQVLETPLRDAPVERHLAALEPDLVGVPASALLPLLAPARGLAEAAPGTTAHALAITDRAPRRLEFVETHRCLLLLL